MSWGSQPKVAQLTRNFRRPLLNASAVRVRRLTFIVISIEMSELNTWRMAGLILGFWLGPILINLVHQFF